MLFYEQFFSDLSVDNKKNILALFVVIKFFVVVGIVAFLVWTIRRNAAREDKETSDLLEELEEGEQPNNPQEKSDATDDWERDPDWWKKD